VLDSPSALGDALRDRYRFARELGSGGMATVWLADDLKHERKVAIKILHPELAAVLGTERFLALPGPPSEMVRVRNWFRELRAQIRP